MQRVEQIIDGKKYTFELRLISIEDMSPPKISSLDFLLSGPGFEELKAHIEAKYPNIKINRFSTTVSLTDSLLDELYHKFTVEEIKENSPRIREFLNTQTSNINYITKRFARIKKIIIERFSKEHEVLQWFIENGGITREQHVERQILHQANRDDRLSNITQVDEKDVQEILNRTMVSPDPFNGLIAIMIAAGCRFIEAVHVSSFNKVPSSNRVVRIVGIAKQQGEGSELFTIDRPLFGMDIDEFLALQERVRGQIKREYPQLETLDNVGITRLLVANVNRRIKALRIEGINSSSDLRKIFGAITHTESNMDSHLHIKTVLGHKNILSAANYANIHVGGAVPQVPSVSTVPPNAGGLGSEAPHHTFMNVEGKMMVIFDDIPAQRGNAGARIRNIIKQMKDSLVLITEANLHAFKFGTKTIDLVRDEKARINAEIMKR